MFKKYLFIVFVISITSLGAQDYKLKIYNEFTDLEKEYFNKVDGKIHFINFWATWCKPCVAELPFVDGLTEKYGDKIKVTLVSLDFPNKVKSKLLPFLAKHNLKSEVVLLDDGKVNVWIDKVDPSWSGAIPASVIFKNGKKHFYEQQFHSAEELEKIITKINH